MKQLLEMPIVSHERILGFKTGDTIFTCLHPDDLIECFFPDEPVYSLKIYRGKTIIDEVSGIGDPSGGRGAADCFFGLKDYPLATAHLQAKKFRVGDIIVIESDVDFHRSLEEVEWSYFRTNETAQRFDLARAQGKERPWNEIEIAVAAEPHPVLVRPCFMG